MTRAVQLATVLISGAVMLVMALAGAAEAQTCGPREDVVGRLTGHFGETRRGIGLAPQNRVVEVFASEDTGTWTVSVTLPHGRTCLIASGTNWEDRADDLSYLADDPA